MSWPRSYCTSGRAPGASSYSKTSRFQVFNVKWVLQASSRLNKPILFPLRQLSSFHLISFNKPVIFRAIKVDTFNVLYVSSSIYLFNIPSTFHKAHIEDKWLINKNSPSLSSWCSRRNNAPWGQRPRPPCSLLCPHSLTQVLAYLGHSVRKRWSKNLIKVMCI